MAPLIALTAISLFAAGVIAGIIGMVSVAIRREEKNLTLTSEATDPVTQAGRWVNGVYVRAPRRRRPAGPSPARPAAAAAPRHSTSAAGAVSTPPVHAPDRTRPRCAMTRWSPTW
jgi:hypothetical protein